MASGLLEAAGADRVVLAPTNELAAALFDAVEREHQDSGREVWATPRVRDFGGWLRERHAARHLADASAPRCLSDVEERELWRRVVLDAKSGREFLEPSGAARAARLAWRTIHEYGIPMQSLAVHGNEETAALLDWSGRFAEQCSALNCISASELLGIEDRAAGAIERGTVAWIESPLWRPLARRWLERNAGRPLEPRVPADDGARQSRLPRSLEAKSAAAELAAVTQWAHDNLRADPDFRAWVCVRDLGLRRAEVADALDAVLAPQRFALRDVVEAAPYAIAGGSPLAEHAPVRIALDFLSACSGGLPFERFSVLLRAPELQSSPAEASAAARLDALLRGRAPSQATLAEWLTLSERVARSQSWEPPAALDRLAAASAGLDELRGSHPMSRWLGVWIAGLERGPWSMRQRWSSGEFQSAERFRELLATLAMGDRVFGSQSRGASELILRRAAHETAFQSQTGIPPIWISGQLSDPWLAYDGLWVTGCDAQRWPPPLDPVPLLPVSLQRRHGVVAASADAQLRFARDLERRWQARARACVFSCAEAAEGHRSGLRPLLAAAEPAQGLEVPPQPHWLAQWREAPPLDVRNDERAPPVDARERTRGISTLKAQSRCAFRGFAETRLSAAALDRPLPGFNERERGDILHDALQRIWSAVRTSNRLRELIAQGEVLGQLLDDSARRAIARVCERRNPGRRWVERERVRLDALLRRWLELESSRAPFAVERLDEGTETARHAGLEFTVRVDRVDRLADGARVLIDYKTGAAHADWRGERPDNPQLPIYALLHRESLVAVAYGHVNAADCGFVVEAERGDIFPGKRRSQLEGSASFTDLILVWERRIEEIAREFAEGQAAVDPTSTACRSCRLHGLCRVPSMLELSSALIDTVES